MSGPETNESEGDGAEKIFGYMDKFKTMGDTWPEQVFEMQHPLVQIGRENRCDIRLHSLRISRVQCSLNVILPESDGGSPKIVLRNLSSKATTKYKGTGIPQNEEVEIQDGDRFHLYDIEFRYRAFNLAGSNALVDTSGRTIPAIRLGANGVDTPDRPSSSSPKRTPKSEKIKSRSPNKSADRLNKSGENSSGNGTKRRKSSEVDMRKVVLQKSFRKSVQGLKFSEIREVGEGDNDEREEEPMEVEDIDNSELAEQGEEPCEPRHENTETITRGEVEKQSNAASNEELINFLPLVDQCLSSSSNENAVIDLTEFESIEREMLALHGDEVQTEEETASPSADGEGSPESENKEVGEEKSQLVEQPGLQTIVKDQDLESTIYNLLATPQRDAKTSTGDESTVPVPEKESAEPGASICPTSENQIDNVSGENLQPGNHTLSLKSLVQGPDSDVVGTEEMENKSDSVTTVCTTPALQTPTKQQHLDTTLVSLFATPKRNELAKELPAVATPASVNLKVTEEATEESTTKNACSPEARITEEVDPANSISVLQEAEELDRTENAKGMPNDQSPEAAIAPQTPTKRGSLNATISTVYGTPRGGNMDSTFSTVFATPRGDAMANDVEVISLSDDESEEVHDASCTEEDLTSKSSSLFENTIELVADRKSKPKSVVEIREEDLTFQEESDDCEIIEDEKDGDNDIEEIPGTQIPALGTPARNNSNDVTISTLFATPQPLQPYTKEVDIVTDNTDVQEDKAPATKLSRLCSLDKTPASPTNARTRSASTAKIIGKTPVKNAGHDITISNLFLTPKTIETRPIESTVDEELCNASTQEDAASPTRVPTSASSIINTNTTPENSIAKISVLKTPEVDDVDVTISNLFATPMPPAKIAESEANVESNVEETEAAKVNVSPTKASPLKSSAVQDAPTKLTNASNLASPAKTLFTEAPLEKSNAEASVLPSSPLSSLGKTSARVSRSRTPQSSPVRTPMPKTPTRGGGCDITISNLFSTPTPSETENEANTVADVEISGPESSDGEGITEVNSTRDSISNISVPPVSTRISTSAGNTPVNNSVVAQMEDKTSSRESDMSDNEVEVNDNTKNNDLQSKGDDVTEENVVPQVKSCSVVLERVVVDVQERQSYIEDTNQSNTDMDTQLVGEDLEVLEVEEELNEDSERSETSSTNGEISSDSVHEGVRKSPVAKPPTSKTLTAKTPASKIPATKTPASAPPAPKALPSKLAAQGDVEIISLFATPKRETRKTIAVETDKRLIKLVTSQVSATSPTKLPPMQVSPVKIASAQVQLAKTPNVKNVSSKTQSTPIRIRESSEEKTLPTTVPLSTPKDDIDSSNVGVSNLQDDLDEFSESAEQTIAPKMRDCSVVLKRITVVVDEPLVEDEETGKENRKPRKIHKPSRDARAVRGRGTMRKPSGREPKELLDDEEEEEDVEEMEVVETGSNRHYESKPDTIEEVSEEEEEQEAEQDSFTKGRRSRDNQEKTRGEKTTENSISPDKSVIGKRNSHRGNLDEEIASNDKQDTASKSPQKHSEEGDSENEENQQSDNDDIEMLGAISGRGVRRGRRRGNESDKTNEEVGGSKTPRQMKKAEFSKPDKSTPGSAVRPGRSKPKTVTESPKSSEIRPADAKDDQHERSEQHVDDERKYFETARSRCLRGDKGEKQIDKHTEKLPVSTPTKLNASNRHKHEEVSADTYSSMKHYDNGKDVEEEVEEHINEKDEESDVEILETFHSRRGHRARNEMKKLGVAEARTPRKGKTLETNKATEDSQPQKQRKQADKDEPITVTRRLANQGKEDKSQDSNEEEEEVETAVKSTKRGKGRGKQDKKQVNVAPELQPSPEKRTQKSSQSPTKNVSGKRHTPKETIDTSTKRDNPEIETDESVSEKHEDVDNEIEVLGTISSRGKRRLDRKESKKVNDPPEESKTSQKRKVASEDTTDKPSASPVRNAKTKRGVTVDKETDKPSKRQVINRKPAEKTTKKQAEHEEDDESIDEEQVIEKTIVRRGENNKVDSKKLNLITDEKDIRLSGKLVDTEPNEVESEDEEEDENEEVVETTRSRRGRNIKTEPKKPKSIPGDTETSQQRSKRKPIEKEAKKVESEEEEDHEEEEVVEATRSRRGRNIKAEPKKHKMLPEEKETMQQGSKRKPVEKEPEEMESEDEEEEVVETTRSRVGRNIKNEPKKRNLIQQEKETLPQRSKRKPVEKEPEEVESEDEEEEEVEITRSRGGRNVKNDPKKRKLIVEEKQTPKKISKPKSVEKEPKEVESEDEEEEEVETTRSRGRRNIKTDPKKRKLIAEDKQTPKKISKPKSVEEEPKEVKSEDEEEEEVETTRSRGGRNIKTDSKKRKLIPGKQTPKKISKPKSVEEEPKEVESEDEEEEEVETTRSRGRRNIKTDPKKPKLIPEEKETPKKTSKRKPVEKEPKETEPEEEIEEDDGEEVEQVAASKTRRGRNNRTGTKQTNMVAEETEPKITVKANKSKRNAQKEDKPDTSSKKDNKTSKPSQEEERDEDSDVEIVETVPGGRTRRNQTEFKKPAIPEEAPMRSRQTRKNEEEKSDERRTVASPRPRAGERKRLDSVEPDNEEPTTKRKQGRHLAQKASKGKEMREDEDNDEVEILETKGRRRGNRNQPHKANDIVEEAKTAASAPTTKRTRRKIMEEEVIEIEDDDKSEDEEPVDIRPASRRGAASKRKPPSSTSSVSSASSVATRRKKAPRTESPEKDESEDEQPEQPQNPLRRGQKRIKGRGALPADVDVPSESESEVPAETPKKPGRGKQQKGTAGAQGRLRGRPRRKEIPIEILSSDDEEEPKSETPPKRMRMATPTKVAKAATTRRTRRR